MYEIGLDPVYEEIGKLETFEKAKEWAKANPTRAFTRAPHGKGCIMKIEKPCLIANLKVREDLEVTLSNIASV